MKKLPGFYNDLSLTLSKIRSLLINGVKDRMSDFHYTVLSTVNEKNKPDARTVILRDFNVDSMTLRIHSDLRAKKNSHIKKNKNVILTFYDNKEKIQLRLRGEALIKESYEKAWKGLSNSSKRCYLVEQTPGIESIKPTSGLPEKYIKFSPNDQESKNGLQNFSLVLIIINQIEWLYLASQGHRRAIFSLDRKKKDILVNSQWLVP